MTLINSLINFGIFNILITIATIYTVASAVFLILDNRTVQSTFAWMLLFIVLPIMGVIIYIFFGRDWKAFSWENKLVTQEIGSDLYQNLKSIASRQQSYQEKLASEKPASYKRKLIQLVTNNAYSLLTGYNDVEILQNAEQKYPRLLKDVKAAKHSIHMLYYIWTVDVFTEELKLALIERAKAGVQVRCLYDASGGALTKTYLQELKAAGVTIHAYLAFNSLAKITSINYRCHRKIVVIDGYIGYVGGLNLDKDQLDGGGLGFWRDTHLRVEGEAVHALQASFSVSWYNTTQEKMADQAYYPPVDSQTKSFTPMHLTFSGPDSQWAAIRQLYFFMILAAEEQVYIQSPFFIPDESIIEALKAAALSGVKVKLILTPAAPKYQIPHWAANTYFAEVAQAGVQVFLYQKGYYHPKTISIDSAICAIGTANMDIRSYSLNYEASAVIYDEDKAKELEQAFEMDLQHSIEFKLEEYQQRPVWIRLRDSISRLASPVL